MRGSFEEWLSVFQRHKDGRIHLHLVVVCKEDIRTGFDFEAVKRRDYSSASAHLRAEWKFWREHAQKYGFGRMELLPMRTSIERFAGYVARYVTRDGNITRRKERGARLVRYSGGFRRVVKGRFTWVDDKDRIERIARNQAQAFQALRIRGEAEFRWGLRWRWRFNRLLYAKPNVFITIIRTAAQNLEYYDGAEFAVAEAWAEWGKGW